MSSALVRLLILCVALPCVLGAGTPLNFTQFVDHFTTSPATYPQRYYVQDSTFKGPGSPIFVIMGGEGPIPPEVGLFYPFVYQVMAPEFGALVIEPEHRFYGASLPFGDQSYTVDNLRYLTPQQALADAATLIVAVQRQYGCTERGTAGYCPVITVGGSYPGFLAAMMRLRYPAVVDIGYAASAPMRFYSQQVDQYAYYEVITKSAERAVPGCAAAVRSALQTMVAAAPADVIQQLQICTPLPDYMQNNPQVFFQELSMVFMVAFANMNMGNYPPTNTTDLAKTCAAFTSLPAWDALRALLATQSAAATLSVAHPASYRLAARLGGVARKAPLFSPTAQCFDFTTQTPSGSNGTVSCGDWSGCGGGLGGESWDYETCSYLIETIGTNGKTDMFPARAWTLDWLSDHCQTRFQVFPQPRTLADLWGFDHLVEMGASRIIFTNGLNDGWSAGGFASDLSPDLLVFNMPNGAHHSDLTHTPPSPDDTPDVTATRAAVADTIKSWLANL